MENVDAVYWEYEQRYTHDKREMAFLFLLATEAHLISASLDIEKIILKIATLPDMRYRLSGPSCHEEGSMNEQEHCNTCVDR